MLHGMAINSMMDMIFEASTALVPRTNRTIENIKGWDYLWGNVYEMDKLVSTV